MSDIRARNIAVVNNGTVGHQNHNNFIIEDKKGALIHSDPLPDVLFFQGRNAELEKLNTWLSDNSVSIIGVRGEGGIGKSTLAAKAFAECSGFAGKFWADVRECTSTTELATRALKEFGVSVEEVNAIDEQNLIPRLLRRLQMGRYLLAIDNVETLLTPAGEWQSGYEALIDGMAGGKSILLLASREYPAKYSRWRRSEWLSIEKGLEPVEGSALLAALKVEDTEANRQELSVKVQGNPLALALIAGWLADNCLPINGLPTDLLRIEGKHRGRTAH